MMIITEHRSVGKPRNYDPFWKNPASSSSPADCLATWSRDLISSLCSRWIEGGYAMHAAAAHLGRGGGVVSEEY